MGEDEIRERREVAFRRALAFTRGALDVAGAVVEALLSDRLADAEYILTGVQSRMMRNILARVRSAREARAGFGADEESSERDGGVSTPPGGVSRVEGRAAERLDSGRYMYPTGSPSDVDGVRRDPERLQGLSRRKR